MTFLDHDHLVQKIQDGQNFLRTVPLYPSVHDNPKAFYKNNLENRRNHHFIIVEPFDEERIGPASYELSLGDQYYATSDELPKDLGSTSTSRYATIQPGEFAVLTSKEYVYVPPDLVGFISIKYRYKEQGLVNVSGFHVDPGFFGRLLFTVFNAGPRDIVLEAGSELFLIMFAELKETTSKPYSGSHQCQDDIPPDVAANLRGMSISPRNLDERLKRQELFTYVLTATLLPIIITLLVAVLGRR